MSIRSRSRSRCILRAGLLLAGVATTGIAHAQLTALANGAYQSDTSGRVAGGPSATANGLNSIAFGNLARAGGNNSVAIGLRSTSNSAGAGVALGFLSNIGSSSGGSNNGVAIGPGATAIVTGSSSPTAIGSGANANGSGSSVAIGDQSVATGLNAIGIGGRAFSPGVQATGDNSTAIGQSAIAAANGAVAMGFTATVQAGSTGGIAFGNNSLVNANAVGGLSFGSNTSIGTASNNAAAVGGGAAVGATSANAAAIGGTARVGSNAANAAALGAGAIVNDGAARSVAIGSGATVAANATDGLALGTGATVSVAGGMAIGQGSQTGTSAPTGTGFLTGQAAPTSFVSFGSTTQQRRLSNLADGAAPSDAVTVAQLTAENTGRNTLGSNLATRLGGGATYNAATGAITGPSYAVQGGTFNDVGSALTALNTATNTNATNIAGNTTAINNLAAQVGNGAVGPVRYANAATPTVPNGGTPSQNLTLVGAAAGTPVTLSNVAPGALSATSTDAVNGSQLFATNRGLTSIANSLGGGATYNSATNTYTPPSYTVQGNSYNNAGDALNGLDTAVTNVRNATTANTTAINDLANGLGNGTVGLVQQVGGSPGSGNLTVGAATGGTAVDFTGTAGTRTLSGVSAGVAPTDAVNVSQLQQVVGQGVANSVQYDDPSKTSLTLGGPGAAAPVTVNNLANGSTAAGSTQAVNGGQLNTGLSSVASSLGGGSTYDPASGQVTAPSYAVQGATYNNVGGALGALDTATTANTNAIAGLANQVSNGGAGPVQYSDAATPTTPNGGVKSQDLTLVGANGGPVALHNVAAGQLGSGSTDAVNGSQLFATSQGVAGNTAALGGGAGFDPATGTYTAPSYAVQGQSFSNVGGALGALDSGVTAAQNAATAALGAAQNSVQYDAGRGSITLNPDGAPTVVRNVGPGSAPTDAVNVAQLDAAQARTLSQANAYTNQQLANVRFNLANMDRRIDAVAASTNALAGLPQVITPGMGMIAVALGGRGDANAVAAGFSKAFNDGHTIFRAGASWENFTNKVGYSVGLGYQF